MSQSRGMLIHLLDADPDLGLALDPRDFAAAERAVVGIGERVPRGRWEPGAALRGSLGGLVVDGLAVKELAVAGTVSVELIGPGDVLLPTAEDDVVFLASETGWTVLEPLTVAWLGAPFERATREWPELHRTLLQRIQRRVTRVALMQNIAQMTRIDDRVLTLLWHLAERFGRMSNDGVVVPLRLTHRVIARLVGARRPSVTTALTGLERRGVVQRRADGAWVLHREPARELLNAAALPERWQESLPRHPIAIEPLVADVSSNGSGPR
jgi:CRP/FNR family transcriptional regulator, cyclic AMP receptor protein